ncbi:MAG: TylF/MycF family methyltransferase [Actinomycetota bacterium]|nr:TylF/MycF family methyltransferase [Actinomycetota bacterium]
MALAGVQRAARLGGIAIARHRDCPLDFDEVTQATHQRISRYSLVSPERTFALCSSLEYLERCAVPGDIVECGVWKGGSMMAAALTLDQIGSRGRDLWLFDTFEGMTQPVDVDVDILGNTAHLAMKQRHASLLPGRVAGRDVFAYASLDEVRSNMGKVAYKGGEVHYVVGPVEETIPHTIPSTIALLRLDTDFYESTKHELENLLPLVAPGGILIVDDYGAWQGARKAVDEYLVESKLPLFLNRIDVTGRLAVIGCPESEAKLEGRTRPDEEALS